MGLDSFYSTRLAVKKKYEKKSISQRLDFGFQ